MNQTFLFKFSRAVVLATAVLLGFSARADDSIVPMDTSTAWVSAQSGDWDDSMTWSPEGVPAAGDSVSILKDHKVTVLTQTERVADLEVKAKGTLSFDGWDSLLQADTVAIYGTVTHEPNTADEPDEYGEWIPNARVNIDCASLMVAAGGIINVNQMGYGPESGPGGSDNTGVGAGYGDNSYYATATRGLAYGSYLEPVDPGSGGTAGSGGGAVRINATGAVVVEGIITSNGAGSRHNSSSSSGGSVYITCETIAGSGTIRANGGTYTGNHRNNAAGGRIAVIYDAEEQSEIALPDLILSVAANPRGIGTLYTTDNQFITRAGGEIRHTGQWMTPGLTEWSPDSITAQNVWFKFVNPGMVLNIPDDITVTGSNFYQHKLEFVDAIIECGGDINVSKASLGVLRSDTPVRPFNKVAVAGDIILQNSATMNFEAGVTNAVAPDSTLFVETQNLTLGEGCIVYPVAEPVTGGTVKFRVTNLILADTASINASNRGFGGGVDGQDGYGPGGGMAKTGNISTGGGHHGGRAGTGGDRTYGLAHYPYQPGSGGASHDIDVTGSMGGGAIIIEARQLVDIGGGKLLADGERGYHGSTYAGGSGGSVLVSCRSFHGSEGAVVSADGGNGSGGGGGGGGRIAIWEKVQQPFIRFSLSDGEELAELENYAGSVSVAPGTSTSGGTAHPGTIMFLASKPTQTLIIIQ